MKRIYKKIICSSLICIIIYLVSEINVSFAESVKTMKIVIDPGHGGHETGAINYDVGIMEKDINLKTSRYLKEYLEVYYGVEIIMTHNGLDNNTEMSILDRGMCARNNNADLLLCLHFNAPGSSGSNWHGAEVYVTANRSCYKYNQESTEIGKLILKNLSDLGIYNRGVKTRLCNDTGPKWEYSDGTKADYYGIIRYAMKGNAEDRGPDITKGTGITSILIEHCFLQGSDVNFINTDAKLKKLAEADGNDKVSSKVEITVVAPYITIQNGEKAGLLVGSNMQLFIDTGIENSKITFKSSNENILKVDSNGLVAGVKEGTAKVTGNLKIKVNTNGFIGSGTTVEIYKGDKLIQTYTCKLYGDVNGDGKISVVDYVRIKNHILKYKIISNTLFVDVADVSNDGKIAVLDYVRLKNDILEIKKLEMR